MNKCEMYIYRPIEDYKCQMCGKRLKGGNIVYTTTCTAYYSCSPACMKGYVQIKGYEITNLNDFETKKDKIMAECRITARSLDISKVCNNCGSRIAPTAIHYCLTGGASGYVHCSVKCAVNHAAAKGYAIINLNEVKYSDFEISNEKETDMAGKKIYSTVVVTRDEDGELLASTKEQKKPAESIHKAIAERMVAEGKGVEVMATEEVYVGMD